MRISPITGKIPRYNNKNQNTINQTNYMTDNKSSASLQSFGNLRDFYLVGELSRWLSKGKVAKEAAKTINLESFSPAQRALYYIEEQAKDASSTAKGAWKDVRELAIANDTAEFITNIFERNKNDNMHTEAHVVRDLATKYSALPAGRETMSKALNAEFNSIAPGIYTAGGNTFTETRYRMGYDILDSYFGDEYNATERQNRIIGKIVDSKYKGSPKNSSWGALSEHRNRYDSYRFIRGINLTGILGVDEKEEALELLLDKKIVTPTTITNYGKMGKALGLASMGQKAGLNPLEIYANKSVNAKSTGLKKEVFWLNSEKEVLETLEVIPLVDSPESLPILKSILPKVQLETTPETIKNLMHPMHRRYTEMGLKLIDDGQIPDLAELDKIVEAT